MSSVTMARFSISPYFVSYVPGKPTPAVTKTVERLLSDAGSFGLYQICMFSILGLLAIVPSMVTISFDLNVGIPKHRCRLFDNDTFDTRSDRYEQFLRSLSSDASLTDKSCTMLKEDSSTIRIPCTRGLVFDKKQFGETLSADLSLVCDRFHLRALTQNLFSAGSVGSLLTGILSDRWGRRKTIYSLVLLLIVSMNTMQLFLYSSEYTLLVFSFCRFFQGFSITFYSVSLVLLSELTGPTGRVLAANILAYSYALGQILLALTARYFKNYKLTYWTLNVYLLPFVLIYVLIPESPLWLVQQNRLREARKIFTRIFNVNRRTINNQAEIFYSNLLDDVIAAREAQETLPSYINVLKRFYRSKMMRKRCLLLIAVWAVALFVYLGISSSLPIFSEDPHAVIIAGAISEILGLTICHVLLSKIERRRLLIIFFLATAVILSLVAIAHDSESRVSMFLIILGKLTASCCQLLIVIYATETYPTALRSTGLGLSLCLARLLAMIGPQLSATQYSVWFPLPYIVYATGAYLAALAASQLPQINSPCNLPDTIHEIEKQQITISPVPLSNEKSLDQRRPSCALIRELGVMKPNSNASSSFLNAARRLSRRQSTSICEKNRVNSITHLPTITDFNENKTKSLENQNDKLSFVSRMNSLPARIFSKRSNCRTKHTRSLSHAVKIEFSLENK